MHINIGDMEIKVNPCTNLTKINVKCQLVEEVEGCGRNADQELMQMASFTAVSVSVCASSFLEVHNSVRLKIGIHL